MTPNSSRDKFCVHSYNLSAWSSQSSSSKISSTGTCIVGVTPCRLSVCNRCIRKLWIRHCQKIIIIFFTVFTSHLEIIGYKKNVLVDLWRMVYYNSVTVICTTLLPSNNSLTWLLFDVILTTCLWVPSDLKNQNKRRFGGGVDMTSYISCQSMLQYQPTTLIRKLLQRCQKVSRV